MASHDFDELLRDAQAQFSRGDFLATLEQSRILLAHFPDRLEPLVLRANAEIKLARWTAAAVTLERLIAAKPDNSQFRRLLGLCLLRQGNQLRTDGNNVAAIGAYQKSIAADPASRDAQHNLALVFLATQRAAEALPLLQKVVAAEPANELAKLDLARTFFALGDRDKALALAARFSGIADTAVARATVVLFLDFGYADRAGELAAALATPEHETVQWILHIAKRLRDSGAMNANLRLFDALLAQPLGDSDRLSADVHRVLGLSAINHDVAAIDHARENFLHGVEFLRAKYSPERVAKLAGSMQSLRWDNFLLAYHGRNDRELAQRFGDWFCASLASSQPMSTPTGVRAASPRPRIGLVSGRWHSCTVGMYFASWVEYLFAHGWDVTLVHVGDFRDEWTEHLARHAHAEITLTGALSARASRLRDAHFDLLLYPELGMDSTVFSLAALRLARVQLCAWGHPSTSGLPTIDGFLSCDAMEPHDAQTHYREPLLLLPGLGTRYPPPPVPVAVSRASLGLPEHRRLYLVPQSSFKLHPDNDAIFGRVLAIDDEATLVFFNDREVCASQAFKQRLQPLANQYADSILFLEQRSRNEYLRVNLVCDVMVDSLYWSGGNTSLDALHCGLPIITCPGELMRGRQSAAMLRALDCAELIVSSPTGLADLAVAIAKDRIRRNELSRRIAANLPAFTDSGAALRVLDATLRAQLR